MLPAPELVENVQNRVMQFILRCSASTWVVNMQSELNLTQIFGSPITYLSIRCPNSPHLALHYSSVISEALDPDTPRPHLRLGGCNLINSVCASLQRLAIDAPAVEEGPGLPPWRVRHPEVSITPTSKPDLPLQQKQLALAAIARVSASVPAAYYVDGSL